MLANAMRVALLTPDFPPDVIGGAGISCSLLALELGRRGVLVEVIALGRPDSGLDRSRSGDASVRHLRCGLDPFRLNQAAFSVPSALGSRCDILHVYDSVLLPAASMIKRRRPGLAVVATINNLRAACFAPELALKESCYCHRWGKSLGCIFRDPEPKSRLRSLLYVHPLFHLANRLSRNLDAYIALSEDLKRRYVGAGFPEERLTVVPNMVDPEFSAALAGAPAGSSSGGRGLTLLFVGQMDHRKGIFDVVEAFARLPAELRGQVRLRMLGRGKDEARLRSRIERLDLSERVEIRHCPYEQLPSEYASADVFVDAARWPEPFGRTRLEALAAGLPILASDTPSAPEVLGDHALYYQPFDLEEMTGKLQRILTDSELRARLPEGREKTLARFAPEQVMPQILGVYEAVTRRPMPSGQWAA